MLTLTIVIPVFNEEHHIVDCLDAIANQSVMPDEVIVVDNNCTDKTVSLAEKYSFVTIVSESQQGRGYARSRGFNRATSDIIGRIDADAKIDQDWVETVQKHFMNDKSLVGVTGIARTSFLPGLNLWKTSLFARGYYWFVHAGFRTITMWGATMAIRRSAWESVRHNVCLDDSLVHEDLDLSLWVASRVGKIEQKNDVMITTSGHTYRYLPKLLAYSRLYRSTKQLHRKNGNLSSDSLIKLSYPTLLPGMVGAAFLSVLLIVISTASFPIDYLMIHSRNKDKWLS